MRGRILWTTATLMLIATAAWGNGQIEGTVSNQEGGVGGVTVVVNEAGLVMLTGNDGSFRFANVPAGTYTLSFNLGDDDASESGVEVTTGQTTKVQKSVDWELTFAETITVFSASRRRERIVDAPAAVTVITEQQIEREATHGQLPKLLEHTPGAEVTQNGLYDFNFNSRGFNSSLNRRILTLVDGRNPSVTFLGNQEWTSLTVPLDEIQSVELVRGPGSALYGADAFNGVINMVTKSPRDSNGGRLKLTGGNLSTGRIDLIQSGKLGGSWFARGVVGYIESEDFARSRLDLNGNGILDVPAEGEYPQINIEVQPLVRDTNEIYWGSVRVDRFFDNGHNLQFDLGLAEGKTGGATVTGIGRVQVTDFSRPHFRLNYNAPRFNFLFYQNDRDADDSRSLSSGAPLYLDSSRTAFELQGNVEFAEGKGRVVGGVSYSEETFDSVNPSGQQTLVFAKVDEDYQGVFGQLEYEFSNQLKGVVSARWDDSSLYDSQVSPRAALVWSVNPKNTLRFTYGEAFQRPNYSEFFLQAPVAEPLSLNTIFQLAGGVDVESAFCTPAGVNCGFDSVPLLALGNNSLELEEVKTLEVGYSGVLGNKVFLTVDYYNSQLENFITDLIFSFDPVLGGRFNPGFPNYRAPSSLPPEIAAVLEATVSQLLAGIDQAGILPFPLGVTLSNNPIDETALVNLRTYANFGEVDTQGVEVGLNANLTENWLLSFTYNWFDFDIQQQLESDQLLPNAPENQFGFGISYLAEKFDAALKIRSVEAFDWAAGVFQGRVESYDLVDISGTYHINDRFEVGVSISNLFDEEHYQLFGGDLIDRRLLGHFAMRW